MKKKDATATPKSNKGRKTMSPTKKQKYAISIDWLEIVFTGTIPQLHNGENKVKISEDLTLILDRRQEHPSFIYSYIVLYKNVEYGYLFYRNKEKYRFGSEVTCQLRINNQRFYEQNYTVALNEIIKSLKICIYNFYRIDIAIDSSGILQRANRLLTSNVYFPVRKVKTNVGYDTSNKNFNYIKFGSGSSENQISIYPKSHYADKPYINTFWQINNLDVKDNEVSRLELRMRTKSTKQTEILISKFENPDYLTSIVRSKVGTWLKFKNSTNAKREENLIEWNSFNEIEIQKKKE
ncbi:MAG: hypothetical protein IPK10_17530 [Bacteroidetes bacterium]|nr:hypothetical protein [Bacteroidota bacterium]